MLKKEDFLQKYKLEIAFQKSELSWANLEEIYNDYCSRKSEIESCMNKLEQFVVTNVSKSIHSIRCRYKDPEHLIEKIIRKRGKEQSWKYRDIDVSNYREIIRDLIGVRILVLCKEEWEGVFDQIVDLFSSNSGDNIFMVEKPVAYTRYGDRDIFKEKIHKEYTNKGYRSQHYIVKYGDYYCEIQVRTLTEEVYGEVDHKVKYPYRENNRFLIRYTNTLSQLLGSVDELISTCLQMDESGWEMNNRFFEMDEYIDWKKTSQKSSYSEKIENDRQRIECQKDESGKICLNSSVESFILRKV